MHSARTARLEDALTSRAHDAREAEDARTGSGLREDQAAAALAVLTDGRLVSMINAPAGSGKTRVLAEAARIWAARGGQVIGITPSQSARNTLAAGVPRPYNAAQFLGHLPGRRGARGPVRIGPGTLLIIDEASMLSGPDLADLIAFAKARGAKIILAGDIHQLQAVENGGGMSLLAEALGYARLAQPVRFRHAWEQEASLRLRDGDTSVLADYDQHGRIIGGDPEQIMDAAAAAYVALSAGGTDTLMMAADHALRRELNRRIRDDLIRLGIVRPGPAVTIADGTRARPGDLVICTRNDHTLEAGEPGRTLANGDLLRIEAITPDGLIVRRAVDAEPRTGQRRWTDRHFLFNFSGCRTWLCGHRSCRPGTHCAYRPSRDHRDRGPPTCLRRADPRHRGQPRLRVYTVAQTRRPGAGPEAGSRAGPVRQNLCRTSRTPRPG
jgi:ATP-dependent exoDNAse (exonuclease V) alpha subunit